MASALIVWGGWDGHQPKEVAEVFREYGMSEADIKPVVRAICADQKRWVDFMMRFELGLEKPDPARAGRSAATIAVSYIVGGLIPLTPYMLIHDVLHALWVSVGVTLIALFGFGAFKGHFTGVKPWKAGSQTVLVGGLAAAVAFGLAKLIS